MDKFDFCFIFPIVLSFLDFFFHYNFNFNIELLCGIVDKLSLVIAGVRMTEISLCTRCPVKIYPFAPLSVLKKKNCVNKENQILFYLFDSPAKDYHFT